MVRSPTTDFRSFFSKRSTLSVLILINIAVFVLVNIFRLGFFLYNVSPEYTVCGFQISRAAFYFAIPSDVTQLLDRPWTFLTYMFLHEDFFHILFNMIMLYFGGILFAEYLGGKKLTATYLLGGIAGALVYIASFNIFPAFVVVKSCSLAMGASASVLAVFIAIATYVPNLTVSLLLFGKIKLKYIAIFFIIIDIFSIEKGNPGGHLAHLGGALFGFIYILGMKKLKIFTGTFSSINKLFAKRFSHKPKMQASRGSRPMQDDEYNRLKAEKQKRTDAILDKISKAGYESLSKEEKEFLFKMSNKK